jgi:hypothetical protein
MRKFGVFVVGAVVAVGLLGAGGTPTKQHRWSDKEERKFLDAQRRVVEPGGGPDVPSRDRCELRFLERHFRTYADLNTAIENGTPEFQAAADQVRSACHFWTAAEEATFLAGTPHNARSYCQLHATEKAFPTYDAWHTASQESTPDGDYTPAFNAYLDKVERTCKHA